MSNYVYDWQPMREYVEHLGGKMMEDWVPATDQEFAAADLTQEQAEAMFQSYAWRVKHLFNPANYTYWNRVKIAAYFLFKTGG